MKKGYESAFSTESKIFTEIKGGTAERKEVYSGITVRDYFASAAMQGLIASGVYFKDEELLSVKSYIIADAMLKEREL